MQPKKLKVLNIDVECQPGHWIGGDFVSKIITAVAYKWMDCKGKIHVHTHYEMIPDDMANVMADVIGDADIVIGHYIRAFDLPLINGHLLRSGAEPLPSVMTHDTKLDLIKTAGRSLSQKNLAAQIGVSKPKVDVTLTDWEGFNTLLDGYRDKGVARVQGDIMQNIEMHGKLVEMGWLGAPQRWDPS